MRILKLLFLSFILIACGQVEQKTTAKISLAAVTGSAKYGGGLMLYAAKNGADLEVIRPIGANDTIELELPNGKWDFKIVGWSGGSKNKMFEGKPKCDFKKDINLNGAFVDVAMAPSYAKCIIGAQVAVNKGIIPSVGSLLDTAKNRFHRLAFGSCIDLTQKLESGDVGVIPSQLGCGGGDFFMKSGASSYKINLLAKKISGERLSGISSDCRPLTELYRNYTDINIPLGHAFGENIIDVKVFDNDNCSGEPSRSARFNDGIKNQAITAENSALAVFDTSDILGTATGNNSDYFNSGESWIFIAIDADGCTPGAQAKLPFAAGSNGEYLICNEEQWNYIAADSNCAGEQMAYGQLCEPEATYHIGADINFGGSNTMIPNPFKGHLEGNNRVLSNGDSPLFSQVLSSSANTNRVRISDLTISAFNINNFVAPYAGIISVEVTTDGSGNGVEFENIQILENSSLSSINTGAYGGAGAFIGIVDMLSASSNEMFFLRHSQSFANVSSDNDTLVTPFLKTNSFATGGLIGVAVGGTNFKIALEENSVGVKLFDNSDPQFTPDPGDPSNTPVNISGTNSVGGMIGYASGVELRPGNMAKTNIQAKTAVGGLVGIGAGLGINNSVAMTTYTLDAVCTMDEVCSLIGGALGKNESANYIKIEGGAFALNVNNNGAGLLRVGGVVGLLSGANVQIKNAKSIPTIITDGKSIGGLIGDGNFGSTSEAKVVGNIIRGSLSESTPNQPSVNTQWGMVAGTASNLKAMRNLIYNSTLKSSSNIGGAIGFANKVVFEENDIDIAVIEATSSNSNLNVGGIVGIVVSTSGTSFKINKVKAPISLINIASVPPCNGSDRACGKIVGNNQLGDADTYNYNLLATDSTITYSNSVLETILCSGFCGSGEVGISNETVDNNAGVCSNFTGASKPFVFENGVCRPLFKSKWLELGYDANEDEFLAGNLLEPFSLNDVASWNAIGADAFLLTKSFRVDQDIDFGGATLVPIGDEFGITAGRFSGNLFGEGIIENVNIDTANSVTYGGLINSIKGEASIGLRNRPLRFRNITINCRSSGACGIIGSSEGGKLFMEVTDTDISSSVGTSNVGGLVGEVRYNLEVDSSTFEGRIATGGANAGGFFGTLGVSLATDLTVSESSVKLKSISAGTYAGGFIGDGIDSGGGTNSIRDSYVWIDIENSNSGSDIIAGTASGGIAGRFNNSFSLENIYVDLSQADLSGALNFEPVGSGSGTASISDLGIIGSVTSGQAPWVETGQFSDIPAMINSLASFGSERWIFDENGRLVREWEIYGHED